MSQHLTRRDVLKTLSGLPALPFLATSLAGVSGEQRRADVSYDLQVKRAPWYRRFLVGIEWGPTGANDKDQIYVSRADGKEIVRHLFLNLSGPPTSAAAAFSKGSPVLPPLMEEVFPYLARVQVNRNFIKANISRTEGTLSIRGRTIELTSSSCHTVLVIHLPNSTLTVQPVVFQRLITFNAVEFYSFCHSFTG